MAFVVDHDSRKQEAQWPMKDGKPWVREVVRLPLTSLCNEHVLYNKRTVTTTL